MAMSVLLYGAETWPITQHDIRRLKTFQMRCLRDIIGVTLWDKRRNTNILEETGELPVGEQLRQKRLQRFGHLQRMPATKAALKMQTKRKEEEARRDIPAMGRSDQQRSNQNHKLARSGDGQK